MILCDPYILCDVITLQLSPLQLYCFCCADGPNDLFLSVD